MSQSKSLKFISAVMPGKSQPRKESSELSIIGWIGANIRSSETKILNMRNNDYL